MKIEYATATYKAEQSEAVRKAWFDHIEELIRQEKELKRKDPEAWERQHKERMRREILAIIERIMKD